jgi:ketosteroid isomerase-like protein
MSSSADVVTGYLDAFSRGDPDEIAGFVAEGFHNEHFSSIASGCVGRDEYRRRLPGFLADFAGSTYVVNAVVEQANGSVTDVVARYDFRATYEGSPIDIPGMMWFTVEDGLISKRTDVWDSGTFFAQTATPD